MKHLSNDLSSISLLHNPPDWAIASSAPSDNLRKRSKGHEPFQNSTKNIHQKKRSRSLSMKEMIQYESNYPHAFIASGIGPDGDGDIRRKRRRKKLLRTGSIVVGCAAILFGFVFSRDYIPLSFSTGPSRIVVEPPREEVMLSNTYEGIIRLATVEGLVDIPKDEEFITEEHSTDDVVQGKEDQETPLESTRITTNPNEMHMLQKIFRDHHEVFCGLFCKHK
jgi:hypothetical protein